MNVFKSVVACIDVIILFWGHSLSAETPTNSTNNTSVEFTQSANSIGMKFKLIPAGTLARGQSDKPYLVSVPQSFQLGIYEVTQKQYLQVIGRNPSRVIRVDNPVEMVVWGNAMELCTKLSALPKEKSAGNI